MSGLRKTKPDNRRLPLSTILRINGLDHAMWATRTIDGHTGLIRLMACDCMETAFNRGDELELIKPFISAARARASGTEPEDWHNIRERAGSLWVRARLDNNTGKILLFRSMFSCLWESFSDEYAWMYAGSVIEDCVMRGRIDRPFTKSHAEALFVKHFCAK